MTPGCLSRTLGENRAAIFNVQITITVIFGLRFVSELRAYDGAQGESAHHVVNIPDGTIVTSLGKIMLWVRDQYGVFSEGLNDEY